jgi:hypothetical protein
MEEQAVMEPSVRKTRSWGSTLMIPVLLSVVVDVKWISSAVIVETGLKERLVTLVSGIVCQSCFLVV